MIKGKVKIEHKLTGRGVIFENEAVARHIMKNYCHAILDNNAHLSAFSLSPLNESETPNNNLREVVFDIDVYFDNEKEYTIGRVQETGNLIYTESDYFRACEYDVHHTYAIDKVLEREVVYIPFEPVKYVTLMSGEYVEVGYAPKPMLRNYDLTDIYSFDEKYTTLSTPNDTIKREPFDYSYFVKC